MSPIFPADVVVKDTGTIKGRGVFALRDFEKGEVVEQCPVIILLRAYDQLPPRIKTIIFNWGNLAKTSPSYALSLGYGSLYNHDNPANLRYEAIPEDSIIRFISVRDIKKDEELTINYNAGGGSHLSEDDSWFKQHNITPF
jgi:SET domain-containing protein